jgi:curved DNA-binding protein CbpA
MPLNPREAFLLSRIDGTLTEADLCSLTGFDPATVSACLDRLAALGAIEISAPANATERVSQPQFNARNRLGGARVSQTQVRAPAEGGETDEVVDLDPDRKQKVLDLHPKLSELDYYELLGISEGAEKKDIKRAYYAVAPNYHPDRFYGKKLGSFKAKMEVIFAQLTFAYETLTSADRRAEYDAYLSTQKQTRSMEELLRTATASEIDLGSLGRGADTLIETSVPVTPAPPGGESAAPNEAGSGRTRETDRARREALARKLGVTRSSNPPSDGRASVPPVSQASIRAAQQELKRRHDVIAGDGRRSQSRRYVEAANASITTNPAAAANALRIALTIEPDNPEIAVAYRDAARLAAVALADGYLKQGDYESRNNQWLEASRSYAKAAAGMPDNPSVMQKAAQSLLKSGNDMHQAADFAKKAVALAPKRIEARLVLIEVYIAAGLPLAAKRELELAREIAPRDDRMMELSKRLK